MLIENLSSYVTYKDSEMTGWEFISEITERADCFLLFDINNVFVSANNHNFDSKQYINGVSRDRVKQFHLAGPRYDNEMIIGTHDQDVCVSAWDLHRYALGNLAPSAQ